MSHADLARAIGRSNINKATRRLRAMEAGGSADVALVMRVAALLDVGAECLEALLDATERPEAGLKCTTPDVCGPSQTLPPPRHPWLRGTDDAAITRAAIARVAACIPRTAPGSGVVLALEPQGRVDAAACVTANTVRRNHRDGMQQCSHNRRRNAHALRLRVVYRCAAGYSSETVALVSSIPRNDAAELSNRLGAPVLWTDAMVVVRMLPGGDATMVATSFEPSDLPALLPYLLARPHAVDVVRLEYLPTSPSDSRQYVVAVLRPPADAASVTPDAQPQQQLYFFELPD